MADTLISKTLAALGDYAALDVLSEDADNTEGTAWVFVSAAQRKGEDRALTHAVITVSVDALVVRWALDLFTANPSTSELDDNSAASVAAAARNSFIGTIIF